MSVEFEYFFVYGVNEDPNNLKSKFEDEEEFEDFIDSFTSDRDADVGSDVLIFDGMDMDYAVFGRVLARSEMFCQELRPENAVKGNLSAEEKQEVQDKIPELFEDKEPEYMILLHVH